MMLSLLAVPAIWVVQVVFVYASDNVALVPESGVERESRLLMATDTIGTLASEQGQQRTEIDQLKAEVAALQSQLAIRQHHVAFTAHLTTPLSPGPNQIIVFDDVRLNEGQAYKHGVFIAPYAGTYLFSVSVCSFDGHSIFVDLLRNGNMIGHVLAGDHVWADCSSETTVTQLSAGDDVTVQHHGTSGDYMHGDSKIHNTFTGVLLY